MLKWQTKSQDETIEYVGILAKLNFQRKRKKKPRDMKMLDYIDALNELDTMELNHLRIG